MFNFFSRLIFRRPKEANRNIFSYWDGYQNQYADPIDIQNRLDLDPVYRGDLHPIHASAGGPEGAKAFEICITAYRNSYRLRPYDPATRRGLTNAEVLELHETFCLYVDALKKNISLTQMQPQFGAPTSTESAEPTTNDTSDTSSINDGRSIDELTKPEWASSSQS